MRRFFRENGLSLVLFWMFFLTFIVGQTLVGHREYNHEQEEHDGEQVPVSEYLRTGHFLEATAENWESEFLQMFVYVLLTAFLYQKGSSESRKLDEENPQDKDPRESSNDPDAPWPVRKGGLVLKLYENSLSITFFLLFLISFWLHAVGGRWEYNDEQLQHGKTTVTLLGYMGTSRFWFESLQKEQARAGPVVVQQSQGEEGGALERNAGERAGEFPRDGAWITWGGCEKQGERDGGSSAEIDGPGPSERTPSPPTPSVRAGSGQSIPQDGQFMPTTT